MSRGDNRRFQLQGDCRGLQAAFAKVSVPEETRGNSTPGTPWDAKRFEPFRRRPLAKLFHFLHRGRERKIARGPDVRAAQRAQKINVRGPAADAFERDKHFARRVVVKFMQVAQVEMATVE